MATLATVKLEYVILGNHKYKRAWGPEIIERLNNTSIVLKATQVGC